MHPGNGSVRNRTSECAILFEVKCYFLDEPPNESLEAAFLSRAAASNTAMPKDRYRLVDDRALQVRPVQKLDQGEEPEVAGVPADY